MRIVIKVGTSTLAHKTGLLNIKRAEKMCKVISDLKNAGHEIVLVSSGAIGMGLGKLGLNKRPEDISICQAAAAIGQSELMYTYDKLFSEYNHTVAQILITGAFVTIEDYGKNLNNTLFRLIEQGVIPIVNENDTVATEELIIGDTEQLRRVKEPGEIEKLRPDAEYIKCYRALADQGHCKYDPNMRYADLPGLLRKHAIRIAQLEALNMAFADVNRGVTLWDVGGLA